jgi:hypothetical protein
LRFNGLPGFLNIFFTAHFAVSTGGFARLGLTFAG